MTERDRGAERPFSVAVAATEPRELTLAERTMLADAMARARARKLAYESEATQLAEIERVRRENRRIFDAALRSCEQPPLLDHPRAAGQAITPAQKSRQEAARPITPRGRFEGPSRPSGAATIPLSLEAAIDRLRPPRPGSPAALALEAAERARPIIEGAVRRKDARAVLLRVLRALYEAAYTLIEARGQSKLATAYTFFTVLDLLPAVTGLSSDQCERATRRLQDLGLIHKTTGGMPTGQVRIVRDKAGQERSRKTYRGGTWTTTPFTHPETGEKHHVPVCAGTWIDVLLRPAPGLSARVRLHELPECPRDLTADRQAGRTAWQMLKDVKVRESFTSQGGKFEIALLLTWALPKDSFSNLVTAVDTRTFLGDSDWGQSTPSLAALATAATPEELVYSLSTIVSDHPQHRREAIQAAGKALARIFRDEQSIRHYYRVLWRATAAEFQGLPAYAQLQAAMTRTLVSMRELPLQRPGAYLLSLLREAGWVESVYRAA